MANSNNYSRKQGQLLAKGSKERLISFSLDKLDNNQGQTLKEWESLGIL